MARPSIRDFLRNFDTYDGSLDKKARKAVTNSVKKLVTLQDCCGHPGEPGC